jgi:signal transduction histidine kinase
VLWLVVLLGLFVLFDVGLFGWLIFRSLSQRELNRIVLETRREAEEIAERIAQAAEEWDQDLYTAIATSTETRTYLDEVLAKRQIVERVEILDREERLVYLGSYSLEEGEDPRPMGDSLQLPQVVTRSAEREEPYEVVRVPVGDVGTFVIGLRRAEIEERLQVLRGDLMRQAGLIGLLSVVIFGVAYWLIVHLVRRSQLLEGKAREAERMAFVGTLASGLAHEIRSPLNSLNLNMQMLEEELAASAQRSDRRLLTITRSEISRLEGLVADFLKFARPRKPDLEVVTGVTLLERARDVLRGRLHQLGAQVTIEDRSQGARVRVDPEQLQQLLLNLVENALQATETTGRRPEIGLAVERRSAGVVLEVTDNGSGMTAEQQGRAVEAFFSTRRGGTGLGLAIVDRIARSHDGELSIRSELGVGTSVEVILPLA